MRVHRWLGILPSIALVLVPAGVANAAPTLQVARTELLYSSSSDIDCSELHAQMNDALLPYNVVRLTAQVDVAPGTPLVYRWSMPKAAGTLAADLDLGPNEQTAAIVGMCAEFGNACVLTDDRLKFYNEPSILWVAPTCDALPKDTSRQPPGGAAKIRVKVKSGRRKLGKATAKIGFGHLGGVTLFVTDGRGQFQDGLRRTNPIGVPLDPIFAATTEPPPIPQLGAVETFVFENGAGGTARVPPQCPIAPYEGCAEVLYQQDGRFRPSVAAVFPDGSALCDNLTVSVLNCSAEAQLDVQTRPKLDLYDPKNPNKSTVDLTVRLKNASKADGELPPCNFQLRGANVLNCQEMVKVGGITDTKGTRFDLPHCSQTEDQACATAADCAPPFCQDCEPNEICLAQNHCSETFTQACSSDADCDPDTQPPVCPNCPEDQTCVRVITDLTPADLLVEPGESVTLYSQTVTLSNVFTDTARMKDTWTATVFLPPGVSADKMVRYKIRGRPRPVPAP